MRFRRLLREDAARLMVGIVRQSAGQGCSRVSMSWNAAGLTALVLPGTMRCLEFNPGDRQGVRAFGEREYGNNLVWPGELWPQK